MTETPEKSEISTAPRAGGGTEARLARVAEDAQETARYENRTVEQIRAGVGSDNRPIKSGAVSADGLELPTIVFTDDQVHNRPQKFEIRPEREGIEQLHLYLRAVSAADTPALVDAIAGNWPYVLHLASSVPLLDDGAFDIDAMARIYTEIERDHILHGLTDHEYTPEQLELIAARHTVTRREVLNKLMALQEWGTEHGIDKYIPGIAGCVWTLAKNCPQNRDWTEETLQEALQKGFTLVDYARLARTLLEVNSVGGGFVDDLVERFTVP